MKIRAMMLSVCLAASAPVYAVESCVVSVPRDCDLVNMEYSAHPHDTTHVVQVTCRAPNGALATYLTSRQAILPALFGVGRDYLPRKISYETWNEDAIRIWCQ